MHAALSHPGCVLSSSPIPCGMPLFQGPSGTPPSHTPNQGYFALSHSRLIVLSHSQLTPLVAHLGALPDRSPSQRMSHLPSHIQPILQSYLSHLLDILNIFLCSHHLA